MKLPLQNTSSMAERLSSTISRFCNVFLSNPAGFLRHNYFHLELALSCTIHFPFHSSGVARTPSMLGHSMGTLHLYELLCKVQKHLGGWGMLSHIVSAWGFTVVQYKSRQNCVQWAYDTCTSVDNSIVYLHWKGSMASSCWGTASSC